MTSWLEYFSKALETQMQEIQLKGSRAIQLDVLAIEYKLSERQKRLLNFLFEKEIDFSIHDYEILCPGINRRTLQRDLSDLIEKRLLIQQGSKKTARYKIFDFK